MEKLTLNVNQISDYLQIASPFLMIDSIINLIPGVSATGIKILKNDDWFFKCHLKNEQAMPGTLQTEAMLQTLVMAIYSIDGQKGKLAFVTNSNVKFLSKVSPGHELIINAEIISRKRGITKGKAEGKIQNSIVCQGEFSYVSPHEILIPTKNNN